MNTHVVARDPSHDPALPLRAAFPALAVGPVSAVFVDSTQETAWGVAGLERGAPVMPRLAASASWLSWVDGVEASILVVWDPQTDEVRAWTDEPRLRELGVPSELASEVSALCRASSAWGGRLLPGGVHEVDPAAPKPGPHYATNLLLGDRSAFPFPLQTTPKSVVDAWGRGSFRSHAATQVLATRWDLQQEENGFPANRQFYLTEEGRQVFYSADPEASETRCHHGPNLTTIVHRLPDGLEVERRIFLLPQLEGHPLACEVQTIRITNPSAHRRRLRLVSTGMFGPSKPGALMEDVLYSTIILQAGVYRTPEGTVLALSPDYRPDQDRSDLRFNTLRRRDRQGLALAREFGTSLNQFLGGGTLERPRGLAFLGNRLERQGPGFFALGIPVDLAPGESAVVETFTGLVSDKGGQGLDDQSLPRQVSTLLDWSAPEGTLEAVVRERRAALDRFSGFLQVSTADSVFDDTVNVNLPFQVLYQSFASRSFCQTQKGYREIGFREVQDLFASMLYFQAQGQLGLVRELLAQWAGHVHARGYANHNFYWVGKEPGQWSDDALWLVQAVARYVELSGDAGFLAADLPTADGGRRSLFETLQAVVRYSCEVSVGPHGLPLLDRADWNDCLKLDPQSWSGPEKERRLAAGERLDAFSESIMNAFLAKVAADHLTVLAGLHADPAAAAWSRLVSSALARACQDHAWKGNWFCRVLVNRPTAHPVVGADGDGLATDGSDGTRFLNSFSWAVLSRTATDDQVGALFDGLETRLKTPFGYQLSSAMDLRRVEPSVATSEYFPGDRENGAVFKHASMMAVLALLEASARHPDRDLARRMVASAWWMIDLVVPSRCLEDPFGWAGNPRFCTQYINSETGRNIGPMLSGTAPWLILALVRAWGVEQAGGCLSLDPLLRESDTQVTVRVRNGEGEWTVVYRKPVGFVRRRDQKPLVVVDGRPAPGDRLPLAGGGDHTVEVTWDPSLPEFSSILRE